MPLCDLEDGTSIPNGTAPTSAEPTDTTDPGATIPTEIEIVVNGTKEKISLSDIERVKTLLQKGSNYDNVSEKWETAKTKLSKAEEVARLYGYKNENGQGTVDEFLETIKTNFATDQYNSMVDTGIPEETAKELLELRTRVERADSILKEAEAQKTKKQQEIEFVEYFRLVNGRPFDDTDKIPSEVLAEEKKGVPLKWAYADYLARESAKRAEIEKINEQNKQSAAPSMDSTGNQGLSFTKEQVQSMSTEEVKKNYGAIIKSMKLWNK